MTMPIGNTPDTEAVWGVGTCTFCGKENVELHAVSDGEYVCTECLGNNYTQCDRCHEYWSDTAVEMVLTKDERILCPDCAEEEGEA